MRRFFVSRARVRSVDVRVVVLLTALAAGVTVAPGHAQAPPVQPVFHTGATAGVIRDATKVGSTIYAVGTWVNSSAGGRLDGVLWTFDGANAPVRTALPDFATNQNAVVTEAISLDAGHIASQARVSSPGLTAAQVTRDPSTGSLTLLNLTPATTFPTTEYTGGGRFAKAISDNGAVLYGQVNRWFGLRNPDTSKIFQTRAMRFDVSGATVTTAEIYPQPATNAGGYVTGQQMVSRAASSDGSVAIGITFSSAPWTDQQAFRYVSGSGVTAISPLPGGTWNAPGALTDDGRIVALIGPSTRFPNREAYLADFSSGTEHITALGWPNEAWNGGATGITGDGSVVTVTSNLGPCNASGCLRYAYFHNSNGWFQLATAMAAAGMDLTGWGAFQIVGVSADGTMVWGSGLHNGAEEGYVAEFPTDYLKNFNVVPAPPADPTIIGVWAADGTDNPSPDNPAGVAAFMRDGTYYQIEPAGFERGSYEFDGSSLRAATRLDTNGDGGLSDANGSALSVSVVGDELRIPAGCTFDLTHPDNCFVAHRITSAAGEINGGWVLGDPTKADSSAVMVFTSSGKYFMAQDGDPLADPGGRDGIEIGQGTWDPATGVFGITAIATDTNGAWGLSNSTGPVTAVLFTDELKLLAGDDSGKQTLTRIVDPATVVPVVTSESVNGVEGSPFTYHVVASHALTFDAADLPTGLSIDTATGTISGTPTVVGAFDATVTATNTFGDKGSARIHLQIDDLTPPVISGTPANISVAATGPTGAVVTWPAPAANDSHDGGVPVVCTPASGSTFPKGTTPVTCTATDAAGNSDATSFYVTVGQPSPPSFTSAPASQQIQATGPGGAVVIYSPAPAAQDAFGQALPVVCTPASGSTLPLGQTKVTCTATDASGLSASVQFTETVVDTQAPVFTFLPGPVLSIEATSSKGAVVSYPTPTVADLVDPLPTMKCDKASGQTYPIGNTTVSCTAADHSGNSLTQAFTVSVVDTIAPTVTVTKPVTGAIYKRGQKLAANYTCTDSGTGVASCVGTLAGPASGAVADGALINTSAAGDYTFTVKGTDLASNIRTVVVTFKVQ